MLLSVPARRTRRDGQEMQFRHAASSARHPHTKPSTDSGALGSSKELGQSPGPTPADGFTPSAGSFLGDSQ